MQISDIVILEDLFSYPDFFEYCHSLGKKLALIASASLEKTILPFQRALGPEIECIVVPDGEKIKTREWKEKIEDTLIQKGYGRESCLIGIGGGTLLDLVGFVAATYCRGIPYLSIPTTLLAMTDAAIGGKTGVNLPQAKNFLGAMHFPLSVWVDPTYLNTLPSPEFWNGFSETIKHSLIGSEELFCFLEKNLLHLQEKELRTQMIFLSCEVKKKIVEEDPFEIFGKRSLLNFGHTVGHALETLSSYSLSHGQAVAYGMKVEAGMAREKGDLSLEDYKRLTTFLRRVPFLCSPLPFFPIEEILSVMALDKKTKKGIPHFVSLQTIGSAIVAPLEVNLLKKGVEHALRCD